MSYNIILFDNNRDYFDFEKWPMDNVKICQTLMYNPRIPMPLIKILRNSFGMVLFSLNDWSIESETFDIAIIPDATANINVLKVLSKKNKAKKQILYYRNRIRNNDLKKIEFANSHGFIVATYSKEDAYKYDLEFVPQCWNKKVILNHKELVVTNDVYFVGEVKNRYKQILDVKDKCEKAGISCLFHIISNKGLPYTQSKRVTYEQVIDNILSSRAVLDIVTEDNWGLTIRPLEALMSERKVITNFTDIKLYDFYEDNKENVFIIGEQDDSRLKEFVDTPFKRGKGIVYRYDTESWINRMIHLRK